MDNLPVKQSDETAARIAKILQDHDDRMIRRKNMRRHTPMAGNRILKTQAPSQLADLDGSRKPGGQVRHYATTKAPKLRFKIDDRFHYDGGVWRIIYMYRLRDQPGVWLHCLEEIEEQSPLTEFLREGFERIGAGSTTPRIVFSEFVSHQDVRDYFRDIYAHGSQMSKTTQELLSMKKWTSEFEEGK